MSSGSANSKVGKDKHKWEVRFCPICGSTEIDCIGRLFILNPHMECGDCGYRGIFIVGEPELALKVREEYLKKRNG